MSARETTALAWASGARSPKLSDRTARMLTAGTGKDREKEYWGHGLTCGAITTRVFIDNGRLDWVRLAWAGLIRTVRGLFLPRVSNRGYLA